MIKKLMPDIHVVLLDGEELGGMGSQRVSEVSEYSPTRRNKIDSCVINPLPPLEDGKESRVKYLA